MKTIELPEIAELDEVFSETGADEKKALILYNDDVNTFEFVTKCLISICGHTPLQAEQCTYLVHYAGKCVVRNGTFRQLRPLCEALIEHGLSAKVEE
jgi:ATP-dependent Clp protease adaptor protein ClpS